MYKICCTAHTQHIDDWVECFSQECLENILILMAIKMVLDKFSRENVELNVWQLNFKVNFPNAVFEMLWDVICFKG